MKYLNLLILVISITACSKDENIQDLQQRSNIQFEELEISGCKGNKAASINNEYLLIEPVSNNKIKVTHQNVMFNCCIDEPIIDFEVKGNSIQANENSTDPVCNCICPYDVEFLIDNLDPGKYNFTLNYQKLQKVKLSFIIPLTEPIQVAI
jgi:hypothetical protein